MAQHSPAQLAAYGGRVGAIRLVSDHEATFDYDVLNAGNVVIPGQHGRAVLVDGRWEVTRDTVCALLEQGGITCPPRRG
jgi:hypothetical protein